MASSATARIDWTSLATKLKPETMASLNGFRRRHADLSKKLIELKESSVTVDLSGYQLKNTKVIAEATKALSAFKPATYDLKERLDFIQKQETKAMAAAKATAAQVEAELKELKDLLVHIETARPVDQLTVEDVSKAYPELDSIVEKMVKRGQWNPPGYYEKFGDFKVGF